MEMEEEEEGVRSWATCGLGVPGAEAAGPDLRRHDFFMTWAPELSTPSLGPVFRPGPFFVGPGAQYGPPGGRNSEKPAVTIFS